MEDGYKMIKRSNPKLHKTFWFWCVLLTPILISVDLGIVMYFMTPNISHLFSIQSINELIIEMKVPIAIAGLSIPFVAMVAAVHRSSQTAHQIQVQTEQNNFANHFKHLEEFKKAIHLDSFKSLSLWHSQEELHSYVYPETINGDLSPREDVYKLPSEIKQFIENFPDGSLEVRKELSDFSFKLCEKLNIEQQQIDPRSFSKILKLLGASVRFSGIHNSISSLDHKDKLILDQITLIKICVEQILFTLQKDGSRLVHLINGEIHRIVNISDTIKQHMPIPKIEAWVTMNILFAGYLNTDLKLSEFIQILDSDKKQFLRHMYINYVEFFDQAGHHDVMLIDNYLKENGL